jgi:hypothetical protein
MGLDISDRMIVRCPECVGEMSVRCLVDHAVITLRVHRSFIASGFRSRGICKGFDPPSSKSRAKDDANPLAQKIPTTEPTELISIRRF